MTLLVLRKAANMRRICGLSLLLTFCGFASLEQVATCQQVASASCAHEVEAVTGQEIQMPFKRGPKAYRFDRFRAVTSNQEKARLDGFARELQSDRRNVGFIVVFGRTGKPEREAIQRAAKAKNYLQDYNRTNNTILKITSCTRPKVEYELWISQSDKNRPTTCNGPAKE